MKSRVAEDVMLVETERWSRIRRYLESIFGIIGVNELNSAGAAQRVSLRKGSKLLMAALHCVLAQISVSTEMSAER